MPSRSSDPLINPRGCRIIINHVARKFVARRSSSVSLSLFFVSSRSTVRSGPIIIDIITDGRRAFLARFSGPRQSAAESSVFRRIISDSIEKPLGRGSYNYGLSLAPLLRCVTRVFLARVCGRRLEARIRNNCRLSRASPRGLTPPVVFHSIIIVGDNSFYPTQVK